jgi:hypothetical protein
LSKINIQHFVTTPIIVLKTVALAMTSLNGIILLDEHFNALNHREALLLILGEEGCGNSGSRMFFCEQQHSFDVNSADTALAQVGLNV